MRYAAIHAAEQAWHARHGETVGLRDLHAALGNKHVDGAVNVAASGETFVQRIVEILPPCPACVVTTTMFQEDVDSIRFEYPLYVPESTDDIGDATQRPGRDDTIPWGLGCLKTPFLG